MTVFPQPPPIEDLSELSWKRVEQRLEEGLVDLGVVESGIVESASERQAIPTKRWTWAVGSCALAAAAIAFFAIATHEEPLKSVASANISEIATQESSTEFSVDGARLEVAPHSKVTIEQEGKRLEFHLQQGRLHLRVAPRDHQDPVIVIVGEVHIEVVGTEFAVYRNAESPLVIVYEGVVAVSTRGTRELVKAGQRWPTEVLETKQAPPLTVKGPKVIAKTKHKTSVQPTTRQLFEQAALKESIAPQEALRLYKRASRGRGPWAANALYAQARLQLAQGRQEIAHRLLTRYVATYPSGLNTADARALLQDLDQ